MRIGLTYDLQTDPLDERQAEFDPPATITALSGALQALGHGVLPLGGAVQLLHDLGQLREVDLVFNIAEGTDARCRESWVPMLLDLQRVPYVGSDPLALALGLDKAMTKKLAVAEGLRTPHWISLEHPRQLATALPLSFPVIVKPRWEGSGRGIDQEAVVYTRDALSQRVEWLTARCQGPVLLEECIAGGELTVLVIGNDPPIALPPIQRPIDPVSSLSYHVVKPAPSRWDCPLRLDAALETEARRMAVTMFETIGCRDVARVDLRVARNGTLYLLEINPLPSFDPQGSFGLLADSLGTTYAELVGRVLEAALRRIGSRAARNAQACGARD